MKVLSLLLLLASWPASALTGSQLLHVCETSQDTCAFYVMGVVEGYPIGFADGVARAAGSPDQRAKVFGNLGFVGYCGQPHQTGDQFARIAHKYLLAHPEHLNQDGAALIMRSLKEAFPPPCKADSSP